MTNKIIGLIKKRSISLIILLTFLAAIFSVGIGKLEIEYSQKAWFRQGDQLLENYEDFKEKYGTDGSMILLVNFTSPAFENKNITRLKQLEEDLWKVPHFVRIESLLNYNKTTAEGDEIFVQPIVDEDYSESSAAKLKLELNTNKQLANYLISQDLKSTALYAYPRNLKDKEGQVAKEVVHFVKDNIIPKYPDLDLQITGGVSMGEAFESATRADLKLLIPLALGMLALTLWLFLRNLTLILISVGLIIITVASTMGLQGWLGIKLGLVTAMCPLTVMAICIMDLVHILSGYKNNGQDILASIRSNIKPTLLTTITTMIGFLSFSTAKLYPIADLGYVATIGIALAWIYTIFLVAPIIYLIPLQKINAAKSAQDNTILKLFYRGTQKMPLSIILFFLAVTGLSLYYTSINPIDSNMQNYFSMETDFAKATHNFKKRIGATNSAEIIIQSPTNIQDPKFLKRIDQFIQKIEQRADVSKALSLIHPLKEVHQIFNMGKKENYKIPDTSDQIAQELFFLDLSLPPEKSLRTFHSVDKKDLRVTILWHNASSAQIKQATQEVEALLAKLGLKGHITGLAPLILGIDTYIIQSFIESMLLATLIIAVFMMLVFRSVFIGILSILPNIIVPSFGAAVLYLLDKPFDTSSVLIFSICLGIAIDDTIYFITRTQEQLAEQLPLEEALYRVINDAGKTLSLTTFILISVFALFILGSFTPNHNFAIATVTVLSFALVLDLVFLPSLFMITRKLRPS